MLCPMLMLTSCATIFGGGGPKMIPVNVDAKQGMVNDYEIFVNGISYGMADLIEVEKGDVITVEADGFKKSVTQIQGKFNGTTLLNLISWGVIGFVVDGVTGNWSKVTTPAVNMKLKAEKN